ncbi:MAG: DedA family protein [Metallosphaera sp.]
MNLDYYLYYTGNYITLFILMLLEGMSLPIPSEVILPLVGYLSYKQLMDLNLGIVIATFGSLTGSIIDYYIALKLGRLFLYKYGKFFKLNQNSLIRLEVWFNKYGVITVFLFRFIPALRALISFPAGLVKMNIKVFVLLTFLGHFIWDFLLAYLGFLFANNIDYFITSLESYLNILLIISTIFIIIFIIYNIFLKNRSISKN